MERRTKPDPSSGEGSGRKGKSAYWRKAKEKKTVKGGKKEDQERGEEARVL